MINRPKNDVYCKKQPTNQALLVFFSPFFLDLYGQVDLCSKRGGGDKEDQESCKKKIARPPIVTKRALLPLFTDDEEEILNAKKTSFPFWRERVVGHLPIAFLGGEANGGACQLFWGPT